MAGPVAVVAAALFVAIAGFQALLALGAPLGRTSWVDAGPARCRAGSGWRAGLQP